MEFLVEAITGYYDSDFGMARSNLGSRTYWNGARVACKRTKMNRRTTSTLASERAASVIAAVGCRQGIANIWCGGKGQA